MAIPEASLVLGITQLLELDDWRALRTEYAVNEHSGKPVLEVGMCDYLYLRYGEPPAAEVMWLEHKAVDGRVATEQRVWHVCERRRGALVLVAGIDFEATLPGWVKFYADSGLCRKPLLLPR